MGGWLTRLALVVWLCGLALDALAVNPTPPRPVSPQIVVPKVDERVIGAQTLGLVVPDLTNAALNRSDRRIGRFKLETRYRASAQPRDWVLEQNPKPNARLQPGGTLSLVLSDGSLVRVPRVAGQDIAVARRELRAVSLNERVQNVSGEPVGRVLFQSPSEGTEVTRGSTVTLGVYDGPAPPRTPPTPPPPRPQPPPPKQPPPPAAELPVPDVVGMTYDDAIKQLARFTPRRSHRASTEPGGRVIAQDPRPPATRPAGAAVSIVLSDGSLTVVPAVRGEPIATARQRLRDAELAAQATVTESAEPVGRVVEQSPAAGAEVRRGSAVRLRVSAGPAEVVVPDVVVPDVVGLPLAAARARLPGFKVTSTEATGARPRGEVTAQQPAAGTRVAPGSDVRLTVSAGQESIEVPNVVDSDVQDARARLNEFRVTVDETAAAAPPGRVLTQDPPAGTLQPPGSTVALTVASAPAAVVPPPGPPTDDDGDFGVAWWLAAAGGVLLLGAGVLIGRAFSARPVPRLSASATMELAPTAAEVKGATAEGPAIRLAADLEHGTATIEPPEPPIL